MVSVVKFANRKCTKDVLRKPSTIANGLHCHPLEKILLKIQMEYIDTYFVHDSNMTYQFVPLCYCRTSQCHINGWKGIYRCQLNVPYVIRIAVRFSGNRVYKYTICWNMSLINMYLASDCRIGVAYGAVSQCTLHAAHSWLQRVL